MAWSQQKRQWSRRVTEEAAAAYQPAQWPKHKQQQRQQQSWKTRWCTECARPIRTRRKSSTSWRSPRRTSSWSSRAPRARRRISTRAGSLAFMRSPISVASFQRISPNGSNLFIFSLSLLSSLSQIHFQFTVYYFSLYKVLFFQVIVCF